ncbi:transcription factor bHLH95-like [Oryza glaberrima]|uniref:transcription factor bHLH95-like n=1 Tax=Oryza glaberrima TaxID=4538 RepID=UPI00224C627B|nr:transcription factor bHLH95-like [Oryza glaberrima]
MAQEGTSSNAPPAAASMGSGDGDNKEGTGESGNNQLLLPAIAASADKGKGVVAGTGNVDAKGKTTATPPAASSTNAPNNQGGGGGGGRSRERMHIFAERERRRKIKNMFTDLRDLVPSLTNKADKATIVGEAISFIRSLEETVADLERRKRERDSLAARCARLGLGGSSSSSAPPPPPPPAAADDTAAVMPPAPAVPPPDAAAVTAGPEPAPGTLMVWSGPSVVLNLCGGDQAFINVSVARRPGVLTMIVDVLERHSIDVVTAQIASDQSRSLFTIHTSVDRERGMFMDTATAEEIYQLAVSEIMVWLHSE